MFNGFGNSSAEIPAPGLESFYGEFLSNRIAEMKTIHEALVAGNFETIRGFAHQWKGFSAPYGFGKLADLAIALQEQAIQQDKESCAKTLIEIDLYLKLKAL